VAWQDGWRTQGPFNVKAQRLGGNGFVGGIINVRATEDNEALPRVAMRYGGAAFVVTSINLTRRRTEVTELTLGGTVLKRENVENRPTQSAAIAFAGFDGNYSLVYPSFRNGQERNIYWRRGRVS